VAKFTDTTAKNARPEKGKSKMLKAAGDGLYLEVSDKKTKTWKHRYQIADKDRWYRIGSYPSMSLKEAREDNNRIKIKTDRGRTPVDDSALINRDSTFKALFDEWFNRAKGPKSKSAAKSQKAWSESHKRTIKNMFALDVTPELEGRILKDIDESDIKRILKKVETRGASNQTLQLYRRLRTLFNYAVTERYLDESPMARLAVMGSENEKDRNLSNSEICTFWKALDDIVMREDIRRALKLILITAQRPGEVIGAHSSEFDGEWWTIPAHRAKNRSEHKVFLTQTAKELFNTPDDGFCFPRYFSTKGDTTPKAIDVNSLSKELRRILPKLGITSFTPHDLRRTAATKIADIGHGYIVGEILNHTKPGSTKIYDRSDYKIEKQRAALAWHDYLEVITTDLDIVSLVSSWIVTGCDNSKAMTYAEAWNNANGGSMTEEEIKELIEEQRKELEKKVTHIRQAQT
jgi:integrase